MPIIKYLYHFTHPGNLPSIRRYGLLSWYQLLDKGISHIQASNELSRSLDKRRNLEDFVRLTLAQEHPMFNAALYYRRVNKLCWIRIDGSICGLYETLFSNDNATSNRALISNNIVTALNSNSQQAEILVKSKIEPEFIYF